MQIFGSNSYVSLMWAFHHFAELLVTQQARLKAYYTLPIKYLTWYEYSQGAVSREMGTLGQGGEPAGEVVERVRMLRFE